ncbi:hypothetical protein V474_14615 [Novosphingobium barchaimii LL02]|uniref:Uncharacterized protein n=2 Tax=Novosphingobium barchaimii TaxID=1420591 RepID=A0A0J7XZK6_9SPHN|nr:hypothetical protein V474_14615 [Novosphingobium barchaimii LL02]
MLPDSMYVIHAGIGDLGFIKASQDDFREAIVVNVDTIDAVAKGYGTSPETGRRQVECRPATQCW